MISKEQYDHWKPLIMEFEKINFKKNRIYGKSKCPFCSGSKTLPFMGIGRPQVCDECDKDGMISNKKLHELGLDNEIEKIISNNIDFCQHIMCRNPKEHQENKCRLCGKPYQFKHKPNKVEFYFESNMNQPKKS